MPDDSPINRWIRYRFGEGRDLTLLVLFMVAGLFTLPSLTRLTFARWDEELDAGRDTIPALSDSLARARWAETARYRQLLRATLVAPDKHAAVGAAGCEVARILKQPIPNQATRELHEAVAAAYRTKEEKAARERVNSELAMTEIIGLTEAQCDSVRATWPPLDPASDPYPAR
ncbi:MAG: hypothetical protein M3Y05_16110 [Gemmatimonadota bacterium]|nr:hypothetical protein [Gemmatimonadota bacterium]